MLYDIEALKRLSAEEQDTLLRYLELLLYDRVTHSGQPLETSAQR